MNRYRKRLFVELMGLSVVLIAGMAALVYYLVRTGLLMVHWVGVGIIVLLLGFFCFAMAGLGGLLLALSTGRISVFLQRPMEAVIFWLLPAALRIGHWLGIERDQIRGSFIAVHNQVTLLRQQEIEPERILILAPVCLQRSECNRKVTTDIDQCARCGGCAVGDLLELRDEFGVHAAIATGGTMARKLIKDLRPQAVVAIACERDLTSGLQDTRELTVLAIPNLRPHGPCFNTQVDLQEVQKALVALLSPVR